jgi:membrane-associated phospholipid phosphatase
MDMQHSNLPGHYRPDPVSNMANLGRTWGNVRPFILHNVAVDAPLTPPPALSSSEYALAFDDVFVNGRDNIAQRGVNYQHHAAVGLYWGYDGANKLGTPPRLYNLVVVATTEFGDLKPGAKLNVLAAINAAMADAGIAAWHWKFVYDFWRPVTAIREASAGWGPSGLGDGNTLRNFSGDPFWKPLGAPRSNPIVPFAAGAAGDNLTPNFPAYPSGHATFGTACFQTFAALVGKSTDAISVTFVSEELDGMTTDNLGVIRPRWEQTFTLTEAIEQNKISRIYLGVHWFFDATGGETMGHAVAEKAITKFTV